MHAIYEPQDVSTPSDYSNDTAENYNVLFSERRSKVLFMVMGVDHCPGSHYNPAFQVNMPCEENVVTPVQPQIGTISISEGTGVEVPVVRVGAPPTARGFKLVRYETGGAVSGGRGADSRRGSSSVRVGGNISRDGGVGSAVVSCSRIGSIGVEQFTSSRGAVDLQWESVLQVVREAEEVEEAVAAVSAFEIAEAVAAEARKVAHEGAHRNTSQQRLKGATTGKGSTISAAAIQMTPTYRPDDWPALPSRLPHPNLVCNSAQLMQVKASNGPRALSLSSTEFPSVSGEASRERASAVDHGAVTSADEVFASVGTLLGANFSQFMDIAVTVQLFNAERSHVLVSLVVARFTKQLKEMYADFQLRIDTTNSLQLGLNCVARTPGPVQKGYMERSLRKEIFKDVSMDQHNIKYLTVRLTEKNEFSEAWDTMADVSNELAVFQREVHYSHFKVSSKTASKRSGEQRSCAKQQRSAQVLPSNRVAGSLVQFPTYIAAKQQTAYLLKAVREADEVERAIQRGIHFETAEAEVPAAAAEKALQKAFYLQEKQGADHGNVGSVGQGEKRVRKRMERRLKWLMSKGVCV